MPARRVRESERQRLTAMTPYFVAGVNAATDFAFCDSATACAQ